MTEAHIGLTDQQIAAVHTRSVSVSLAAGAGCGKTFVLTQRFLAHLDPEFGDPVPLRSLVAITFTERAAREMRARIRAECLKRLRSCSAQHVEYWLKISREIDSARISTIHSFCASILRTSAVEAKLDPRFGLLEPGFGSTFQKRSISESVIRDLSRLDADILAVIQEFGLNATVQLCEALLSHRIEIQNHDSFEYTPERLAAHWRTCFNGEAPRLLICKLIESNAIETALSALGTHNPTHPEMALRVQTLKSELDRFRRDPWSIAQPLDWMKAVREQAKVQGGGGKKAWPSEEIYSAVSSALKQLREAFSKCIELFEFDENELADAARLSLQVLRIAGRAIQQYENQKSDAALLDFDDLLWRTRNMLRDEQAVRTRVSSGISHLLVDEFQDTDPIQADIVRLICGNQLAHGKLFLVGDAQQSIYRFRRADPDVFHQLRRDIPHPGRLPLNRNFRSQPAILNFVNALFAGAFDDEVFQQLLPDATQLSPEPAVEFLFPETIDAGEMESAEDRRRSEARWIAGRIREILSDKIPRVRVRNRQTGETELRTARQGDIVVLFRALTDIRFYEEAFREYQLDYYLVGGRAFFAQQEIFDFVNLLRFLIDPEDQISLLGCLRSPLFGLTDDTLMTLVRNQGRLELGLGNPPLQELTESQGELVTHADRTIRFLYANKDRMSIVELMEKIIELTCYDASLLTEFLGTRKLANLRKLVELSRQFVRSGGTSLAEFVTRLVDSVGEETDEAMAVTKAETDNVIRLMSIHQSKGLEFPIVILADMDRRTQADFGKVTFHRDLGPLVSVPEKYGNKPDNLGLRLHRLREAEKEAEENLRLLYVALTRAADVLILSGAIQDSQRPSSEWMKLIASRFELTTGKPRIDPVTGCEVIPTQFLKTIPKILVHRVPPRSPLIQLESKSTIPLRELKSAVSQANPVPIPPLVNPVQVNSRDRVSFSVSLLEQIDSRMQETGHVEPGSNVDELPDNQEALQRPSAEELGTLVHAVLERINRDTDDPQVQRLIDACWNKPFEELSKELRESASEMVRAFQLSPLMEEMSRSLQCHREIDFRIALFDIKADGRPRFVTGQIDCLFQREDGEWVIIDYKTGDRFQSTQTDELIRHYEFQLGVYAWAIAEAFGHVPKRVELVTFRPQFRQIGWDATPDAIKKIQHRVRRSIEELLSA